MEFHKALRDWKGISAVFRMVIQYGLHVAPTELTDELMMFSTTDMSLLRSDRWLDSLIFFEFSSLWAN